MVFMISFIIVVVFFWLLIKVCGWFGKCAKQSAAMPSNTSRMIEGKSENWILSLPNTDDPDKWFEEQYVKLVILNPKNRGEERKNERTIKYLNETRDNLKKYLPIKKQLVGTGSVDLYELAYMKNHVRELF